jgi:LysM repeat protein
MALASQNARPDRNNPNARGRGPTVFVLIAIGAFAAFMGIRALIGGGEDGSATPRSASASETITTQPENQTRRTALDEAISNAGTDDAPAAEQKTAPTVTAPAEPAPTPTPAPTATPTPEPRPEPRPEPTPAPAQPPVATPEQPKNDGAAAQEAPKEPKDTTSPTEQVPEAKPAAAQPFFGNGLNASKPLVTPTGAGGTEPPADSPAGKLKAGLAIAGTEPVKARALLSAAVLSGTLNEQDSYNAFNALAQISSKLFLTPVFNAGDTACMQYTVEPNDSLEKIVRKNKIGCDWRLVARLNNIKKPESIQVGKRLKLPKGPFSAVVWKRDYRIDICVGEGADRVIVVSMPVGLGEANGTPTGMFKVRNGSKLLNPEWTHPVTGQRYAADDPANPIGEHWLGLEGTEEKTSSLKGYGIHGTVEPDSIGQNRSLGCVRLLAGDVALVWECLGDGAAVEIRP